MPEDRLATGALPPEELEQVPEHLDDEPTEDASATVAKPGGPLRFARMVEKHYQDAQIKTDFLSLTDLPREVFDGTSYATKPPGMVAIQQRVLNAAGLHIVTPEYNGSFPGVLKYFIDMLKLPDSFEAKPVAFTGEAAGIWGAIRPIEQLQQIFGYRNAHIYPDRVFIPNVASKITAEGVLTDAAIDDRLAKQVRGFAAFSGLFAKPRGE